MTDFHQAGIIIQISKSGEIIIFNDLIINFSNN